MINALTKSGAFTAALSNLKGAALNAAAPPSQRYSSPDLLQCRSNAPSHRQAIDSGKSIASLKSTAKAMGGVAAGTNAAKALAGFDTINTLDTSSGSGGSITAKPAYEATVPRQPIYHQGRDWAEPVQCLRTIISIAGWDDGWGRTGCCRRISFVFSFTTFYGLGPSWPALSTAF
ncbi:MAG: hypothetical protein ACLR7U_06355 [Ruthenibacterium lactatiformans]